VVFGRANFEMPRDWLSLRLPHDPSEIAEFATAGVASGLPLEISHGKSAWGPFVEHAPNAIVAFGSSDFSMAGSRVHACDLVSAQIVEILSCLHGKSLTVFFLPLIRVLESHQWDGAIEALESAREDGLILSTGLSCDRVVSTELIDGQFRDAFDAVCVRNKEDFETVSPIVRERRMGVLTTFESGVESNCRLHEVCTIAGIESVCGVKS